MQLVWNQRWSTMVAGAGFAGVAAGFVGHRMWLVLPWERFALSLLLAGVSLSLAWPVRRVSRIPMASALALAWLLAAIFFVGIAPLLAILLMASAAWAMGLRVLYQPTGQPAHPALAISVGLVLIGGLAGWLLQWPLHTMWSWGAVLGGLVAWQWRLLRASVAQALVAWQQSVDQTPRWSAFAVILLGLASTACWLPTMQADDLAYHLGLPTQLLANAQYRPSAQHQNWSHAPWLGDTLQGIGFVLARGDARGALNLLWLSIAAGSAWMLSATLRADPVQRWGNVALLASFPPLVWMAAGMQTELPALTLLLLLATVAHGTMQRRLRILAILGGGLFALKLIAGMSAMPLLLYAVWRERHTLNVRRLSLAATLFIAIAASSYASAWWHTGNPVFPLFNSVFQSPDYPLTNFTDPRWQAGFEPLLPWRLVFDTAAYVEAWDGAIGFALLALAGGTLLAIRDPQARWLTLSACAVLLLSLLPLQYARYAFPALALLAVVSLHGVQVSVTQRTGMWLVAGLCLLNLAFQANSSWLHHSAALKRLMRNGGDNAVLLAHYTPERALLRDLTSTKCPLVLATDPQRNTIAELAGCGRTVSAHDSALAAQRVKADLDDSGLRWQLLITASKAQWLLVTPAVASQGLRSGLVLTDAHRVRSVGDAELWQVSADTNPGLPVP